MTFPLARSPYANILLYTPRCSSTFTIANGVQGKIDLTVPSGGVSSVRLVLPLRGVGRWDAGRGLSVRGEMNRVLQDDQ